MALESPIAFFPAINVSRIVDVADILSTPQVINCTEWWQRCIQIIVFYFSTIRINSARKKCFVQCRYVIIHQAICYNCRNFN